MVPNLGTMSFKRKKTYKRKDGTTSTYYYRVENKWVEGKTKQKVVEYLGSSPNRQKVRIDPATAGELAAALFSQTPSAERLGEVLGMLGIQTLGEVTRVSLVYDPPLGHLDLVIE
jgi:hypothetical protein